MGVWMEEGGALLGFWVVVVGREMDMGGFVYEGEAGMGSCG